MNGVPRVDYESPRHREGTRFDRLVCGFKSPGFRFEDKCGETVRRLDQLVASCAPSRARRASNSDTKTLCFIVGQRRLLSGIQRGGRLEARCRRLQDVNPSSFMGYALQEQPREND